MTTGLEVIPLAKPVIGEREEQAVLEVLRSGQLSLGPRLPQFERDFAAKLGVDLSQLTIVEKAATASECGGRTVSRCSSDCLLLIVLTLVKF